MRLVQLHRFAFHMQASTRLRAVHERKRHASIYVDLQRLQHCNTGVKHAVLLAQPLVLLARPLRYPRSLALDLIRKVSPLAEIIICI